MSLGEFMQGARESAGLSIDELAERTSIRAGLLKEIENNNFIHCGGDTYARGHLRNIAAIISVDAQSHIFWYETPVASVDALTEKLKKVAHMKPQPEVQVRGDMAARYEGVGRVLLACQRAGIVKVAFITEPPPLN